MYTFFASDKSNHNYIRNPNLTLIQALRLMRDNWTRWDNVAVYRQFNPSINAYFKHSGELYGDRMIYSPVCKL